MDIVYLNFLAFNIYASVEPQDKMIMSCLFLFPV